MTPREKALGKRVERLFDERGAWWLKTQPPNRTGVSDYLVCYRGRFLGIETKREGGRLAPLQIHELKKIIAAGGIAIPAFTVEAVEAILDRIDQELDG